MTKDRFITIQRNRGYHVEELGCIVILTLDNYRAVWFFNPDGTVNEDNPPHWAIERPH